MVSAVVTVEPVGAESATDSGVLVADVLAPSVELQEATKTSRTNALADARLTINGRPMAILLYPIRTPPHHRTSGRSNVRHTSGCGSRSHCISEGSSRSEVAHNRQGDDAGA